MYLSRIFVHKNVMSPKNNPYFSSLNLSISIHKSLLIQTAKLKTVNKINRQINIQMITNNLNTDKTTINYLTVRDITWQTVKICNAHPHSIYRFRTSITKSTIVKHEILNFILFCNPKLKQESTNKKESKNFNK